MHYLPLAPLSAKDRGDTQNIGLRWRTIDRRGRVLERYYVGEVTARTGGDDLVLEGLEVRESRRQPLEQRSNLSPPNPIAGGAEHGNRIVVRPHGEPRGRVAAVKSDLRLVQSGHGRRQEVVHFCAHNILRYW